MQINREQLKDRFFLDEHRNGIFALQLAVKGVNDYLLGLCEEAQISAKDLRSAILLARDKRGKTAWQLAVRDGRIAVLERLWIEQKNAT